MGRPRSAGVPAGVLALGGGLLAVTGPARRPALAAPVARAAGQQAAVDAALPPGRSWTVTLVLDPALFDVTALIRDGDDDAHRASIPLIVQGEDGSSGQRAAAALGPGVRVGRSLGSIDAVAVSVPKASAAQQGRALAAMASATVRAGRVTPLTTWDVRHVWYTVSPTAQESLARVNQHFYALDGSTAADGLLRPAAGPAQSPGRNHRRGHRREGGGHARRHGHRGANVDISRWRPHLAASVRPPGRRRPVRGPLPQAAPGQAVSLRVAASDSGGSGIDQTIMTAYPG